MRHGLRNGDPGAGAWWRGGHGPHVSRHRCDAVAGECAAFLDGTFGAVVDHGRWLREPWTWVNELAHGSVERLEAAADLSEVDGSPNTWEEAVSYLAVEILAGVGHDPVALATFQHQYLFPLESAWALGTGGQTTAAPVAAVRAALARSWALGRPHSA